MLQRVSHGASLEVATPDEVKNIIRDEQQRQAEDHRSEKGVVNLGATGAGSTEVKVPREYNWRMERVTVGGPGAVNALVLIYGNSTTSDADLLEVIQPGATGRYSDSFANTLWVNAGDKIIVAVTNGVANGQVTFNFQIVMLKVM